MKKSDGERALIRAICKSDLETVKALLDKGVDANTKDRDVGLTALMWTAVMERSNIVEALLKQGAAVDAKDEDGMTALMWAALEGHHRIVRVLLRNGADVKSRDKWGWTTLMFAVRGGSTATVRALLPKAQSAGILNVKDKRGRTALRYAKEEEHNKIAQLLAAFGAKE